MNTTELILENYLKKNGVNLKVADYDVYAQIGKFS